LDLLFQAQLQEAIEKSLIDEITAPVAFNVHIGSMTHDMAEGDRPETGHNLVATALDFGRQTSGFLS
jgi:hypothetical protein